MMTRLAFAPLLLLAALGLAACDNAALTPAEMAGDAAGDALARADSTESVAMEEDEAAADMVE